MAGIDVSRVLVGAPDQKVTGAVLDAPVGTKLPTSATEELDEAFTSSGYVSEDGITLTQDRSTNDIKDWSKKTVRKVLDSFDATIAWSELQMSVEALRHAFGEDAVTETKADATHGARVTVALGEEMPEARSWVFRLKDNRNRMLIVVPNGQVTAVGDMTFAAGDAVALPITLSCYPDANGKSIYIYMDDGEVAA